MYAISIEDGSNRVRFRARSSCSRRSFSISCCGELILPAVEIRRPGVAEYTGAIAVGSSRNVRSASTRRLPTCGPSQVGRDVVRRRPTDWSAGATPWPESIDRRHAGRRSFALRICRSVGETARPVGAKFGRAAPCPCPGGAAFLSHRSGARARRKRYSLILLPLLGAQPTWRDLSLTSSRSKMTPPRHRLD